MRLKTMNIREPEYKKYLHTVKPLPAEKQKELWDFLLTILADTRYLHVKCLASHQDKYLEINDKFNELGLNRLKEDWSQGEAYYNIVISFRGLIGSLIELNNIQLKTNTIPERFEVDTGDKGLMIYDHDGVDDYYFVNDEKELQEFCDLVNEVITENQKLKKEKNYPPDDLIKTIRELTKENLRLNEENKKLKSNEDALIKQLDKLHKIISELAVGLENKSKEHRENDFKLRTLEKYYTCPNCAFNSKEFKYIRSLEEKRK